MNSNFRSEAVRFGAATSRGWLLGMIVCVFAMPTVASETARPRLPRHSDVVFMYQASPETYRAYGATVLAWGGTPRPQSLQDAEGVTFFGSVGMVTEFARYHDRFPETYLEGVCRDLEGQPFRVPWLTDHQHRGIPFWWCCTEQPQFRQYLEERVAETVRAGAHGVHMDDHLGSAGALFLGGCFCDRCVAGFLKYLGQLPADAPERADIPHPGAFDFRQVLRGWIAAAPPGSQRRPSQHPLWHAWTVYHCRAAATFMNHLRALAARTAGREVPMSANAGVLWPNHLVDYQALDFLSAEIDHHAAGRQFSNLPLFAYRLADAVERPLASTASGQDWAFIKAEHLPGLVQGWIALGYAAGHSLMAPHRQWCYTAEKGTHWYAGPQEKFAPLYQFVRQHPDAFDGYETYADVVLLMPHRAFRRDRERWFQIGDRLSSANIPWRLVLGGDDLVNHPITSGSLRGARLLLNPDPASLEPADRELVQAAARSTRSAASLDETLSGLPAAVRVEGNAPVRVLPRVKPGGLVLHLINWDYAAARDSVQPVAEVSLALDLAALGVPQATTASVLQPGGEPRRIAVADGRLRLTEVGLWNLLLLAEDR